MTLTKTYQKNLFFENLRPILIQLKFYAFKSWNKLSMVFKDFTLSLLTKQRTKFIYEKLKLVFRFANIYIKKHYFFEKPFCCFCSKKEFSKKVKKGGVHWFKFTHDAWNRFLNKIFAWFKSKTEAKVVLNFWIFFSWSFLLEN